MLVIVPLWVVPESVEAQIGLSLWMRKSVLAAGKDSSMKMLMEMRKSRHLSGWMCRVCFVSTLAVLFNLVCVIVIWSALVAVGLEMEMV